MNPTKRREIFLRLQAANPHPTTELEYSTPFELLVAVILSAQATDKSVNIATRELFPVANTPQTIFDLGEAELRGYVQRIGLYQTKSKHIIQMCRILLEQHGGQVPHTREALEALPGVGRKTANVMLNTAFGQPTIAVDTHIFRVSNRTGLAPGKDVTGSGKETDEVRAGRIQARCSPLAYPAWTLCVRQARKPKCGECIIESLCEYKEKSFG